MIEATIALSGVAILGLLVASVHARRTGATRYLTITASLGGVMMLSSVFGGHREQIERSL